jgi:hypothetical protein
VVQEVPHGRPTAAEDVGKVRRRGRVQGDPALLDELEDRRRGVELRTEEEVVRRVGRRAASGTPVRQPARHGVHPPVAVDHGDGAPRNVSRAPLRGDRGFEHAVDPAEGEFAAREC